MNGNMHVLPQEPTILNILLVIILHQLNVIVQSIRNNLLHKNSRCLTSSWNDWRVSEKTRFQHNYRHWNMQDAHILRRLVSHNYCATGVTQLQWYWCLAGTYSWSLLFRFVGDLHTNNWIRGRRHTYFLIGLHSSSSKTKMIHKNTKRTVGAIRKK